MKDLYVIIYRQEDKPEELYSTEDLKKAMYVQQALISYGEVTTDNLKKARDSITEDDINYFNEQEESVDIELNSIDQLSDTSAVAEYQLGNMVVKDLLATSPRLVSDTTTHINLVKRHGKWFADMTR